MRDAPAQHRDLPRALLVGAVVLAAGSAARIGHRPKCLLELDGEPLIRHQLRAILGANIKDIVVVLGHYAEQIKPIITKFPVTLVHNPNPDTGQNSSLHCGLNTLPRQLDAVMVTLADQPLLNAEDIDDLIQAYRQRPAPTEVLAPTVDALPGNPVLFSAAVRDAILARDNTFGCKQWQLANPERVYRWPTANLHYRLDIDTLEDIESFAALTGLQLRWPSPQKLI